MKIHKDSYNANIDESVFKLLMKKRLHGNLSAKEGHRKQLLAMALFF